MRRSLVRCAAAVAVIAGAAGCSRDHGKEDASRWEFRPTGFPAPSVPPVPDAVGEDADATESLGTVWEAGERFAAGPERQSVTEPQWASPDYLQALARVVEKSPNSIASLTARLEIAMAVNTMRLSDGATEAGRQLRDLAAKHSETWQGRAAGLNLLLGKASVDVGSLSEEEIAGAFRLLGQLSSDSGYTSWRGLFRSHPEKDPIGGLRYSLAMLALDQKRPELARRFLEELIGTEPESGYARRARSLLRRVQ